ncbi:lateral flagellar hook-associated protein 2 [Shewanella sp. NFH-SH190041]|uniref:flagellar filament capping protein FliD n=1 Tax=Shewanella sp. NFH-SH190041 TaxID=2950245 RepID=UPI0021C2FBDD|nr:flagellar filament capping protein FliD [Shewanella sp. NFH-SH190041]BDM62707.1 lateral flagellar hook-associated protein 2 [Shewanella sp. NFH-SH190041]
MINGMSAAQFAQKLVQVERQAKDKLFNEQKHQQEAKIDAYRTLGSALSDVTSSLSNFSNKELQAKKADVTGDSIAVTVADGVPAANYKVEVKQLAQAQQLSKEFDNEKAPLPSSGVLHIEIDSKTIELDLAQVNSGGTKTVADLRDIINDHKDNPGVRACLVRTGSKVEFMLTADEPGLKHAMKITMGGKDWGMVERAKAQDAEITLNGIKITSDKNQLTNVIDGMNIELKKADEPGKSSMVSVQADTDTTEKNVSGFVDSINALLDKINSLTVSKKPDDDGNKNKNHAYMAQDKIGILAGDASIRSLQQKVRNLAFQKAPNGMRLSDIGIELNRYGQFSVNKTKLNDVMKNTPELLDKVLGGKTGLVDQLKTTLKPFTKFDGYVHMKKDDLNNQLDSLNDQIDSYNTFMNNRYQIYLKQFTAMEQTIGELSKASGLFE